jgi:thioredoxin-like negative regulator of GroEL
LEEEVFEIDTDKEFELSVSLGVKALPKIKVFKSGQLVREYTGVFNTTADARFFVKNTNSENV